MTIWSYDDGTVYINAEFQHNSLIKIVSALDYRRIAVLFKLSLILLYTLRLVPIGDQSIETVIEWVSDFLGTVLFLPEVTFAVFLSASGEGCGTGSASVTLFD